MSKRSPDDFDTDPTDELPVLLETVALEDALLDESVPLPHGDATGEQTALHHAVDERSGATGELRADLAERTARVTGLEVQIAALTDRGREIEQRLADKDRLIGELRQQMTTLGEATHDSSAAERQLAAQLAFRDARIAELTATVERLQGEATTHATELDGLRTTLEATRREAASLKSELAARPTTDSPPPEVQALLEEKAVLAAYIATRRTWWDEAQATQAEQTARIAALQHELSATVKQLRAAEALAAQESSRASALRAELVDHTRRATDLERELRAARAVGAPPASAVAEPSPATMQDPPRAAAGPPPHRAAAARASQHAPVEGEAIDDGGAPTVEAVAQLEAEVEYKRQQVAAQLVELRDRDERLRALASEVERVRRDLATLRSELDESRSTAARLERAVIDKDRSLEARDARIATLQEELKQRQGAPEKASDGDFALPRIDPADASRAGAIEANADVAAPALVCLTGDAPRLFPLTKATITIGRGPHCELQILTHFVSREHARITLNAGRAFIEDAGSRNGVFVNSVRVDRQVLQQGDLITVGDTQFRFVESMAH
jgi:chromosome segregation ATPase